MSACLAFRHARCALKISPTVLKTLSDGTLVAGIHRIHFANLANFGNLCSFIFHHESTKGSDSNGYLVPVWNLLFRQQLCWVVPAYVRSQL